MRFFLVFFLFFTFPLWTTNSQTIEDRRRIEEEKREILLPSENPPVMRRTISQPEPQTPEQVFFKELIHRKIATLSDAYAALTILAGYQERYSDFNSQRDFLRKNKILPDVTSSVGSGPERPLERGSIAYMLCKLLDIKGGVWMRLFGPNVRYSLKELIYEGIISPGASSEYMSGKELIFTTAKAAEFLAKKETAQKNKNKKENSAQ